MAQTVKNLPGMWETSVYPWVGKIPWKKATHSNLLAWRIPWTEEPGRLAESDMTPWDLKELDMTE